MESDGAFLRESKRNFVPSNYYANLLRLDKVYQSFEDTVFNARNDQATAAGKTTWFSMLSGESKERDEAIEQLKDKLFLEFPGMLPEIQVSKENPRWFRVFVTTEDLNMKYFGCREIVCSPKVFWIAVILGAILFV